MHLIGCKALKINNLLALRTAFSAAILVAIGLASCGSDGPNKPPVGVDPTFSSIQEKVFTVSCALSGCHDADQREAGMCLDAAESYANLVGVPPTTEAALSAGKLRIDPGHPENSFILDKLRGPALNEGHRMPLNSLPLSEDVINVIETWIANGAQP